MAPLHPDAIEEIVNRLTVLDRVQRVVFLGEGEFSQAWLVNDEWVCRFAKHAAAITSLQREACLLPRIAGRLSLAVPQPVCYPLPGDPVSAVAIHRLLAGDALTHERFEALDDAGQDHCAAQIAGFLAGFHATDTALAESCGILRVDYRSRYGDGQERAEKHLLPRLDRANRDYVQRIFDRFYSSEIGNPENVALLHGDVGPDHVLWSPARLHVLGILDFGDMEIGDVAWDVAYIREHYGSVFLNRFMRHFRSPDAKALLRRAYLLRELDAVEWAANVCAGEREGDPDRYLARISAMAENETRRMGSSS
ncbi:MAG: phosphotransferase [Acidobacteriota bacterium]|nr:phosphotransferase [Acidobacteriota bacterium]